VDAVADEGKMGSRPEKKTRKGTAGTGATDAICRSQCYLN
jgi:hypothetical protein